MLLRCFLRLYEISRYPERIALHYQCGPMENHETMEAFEKEFSPKPGFYDPDVEVSPRVRAILVALDTP
jgi:hypothetical protein